MLVWPILLHQQEQQTETNSLIIYQVFFAFGGNITFLQMETRGTWPNVSVETHWSGLDWFFAPYTSNFPYYIGQ